MFVKMDNRRTEKIERKKNRLEKEQTDWGTASMIFFTEY